MASLVLSRLTDPARSIPEIECGVTSLFDVDVDVDGNSDARGSLKGTGPGRSRLREGNNIVPLGVNAAPIGGREIPEEDLPI